MDVPRWMCQDGGFESSCEVIGRRHDDTFRMQCQSRLAQFLFLFFTKVNRGERQWSDNDVNWGSFSDYYSSIGMRVATHASLGTE